MKPGRAPLLLALSLAACSAAPLPPPPPAPPPPAAKPEPPRPALVLPGGLASKVGMRLADGSWLVLLSGKRVLVAPDGSLREERVPTPEPLHTLLEVPTASGMRLVGVSAKAVYRFDDPLGAPITVASGIVAEAASPGPGYVVLFTGKPEDNAAVEGVDVETGKRVTLPWPALRGIAFRSMKHGAVLTATSGLRVTGDGGARFYPVELDRDHVDDVEVKDGALLAWTCTDSGFAHGQRATETPHGRNAQLDRGRAAAGPLEERRRHPRAPGLVRWIEATGTDPRAVAVQVGVALRPGEALAAAQGLVARVELASGRITDLADYRFSFTDNAGPCSAGRAGKAVWLSCPASIADDSDAGPLVLDLEGDRFALRRAPVGADLSHQGWDLTSSPTGGALVSGACRRNEHGDVCVLQPDGRWKTLAAAAGAGKRVEKPGFIPLAGGGVAYATQEGPLEPYRVVVIDAAGQHRVLPAVPRLDLPKGGQLALQQMEQRADGALQLLFACEVPDALRTTRSPMRPMEGEYVITQPLDGEAARLRRVEHDQRAASVHRAGTMEGGAVALGAGRTVAAIAEHGQVALSIDAGATWTKLGVPECSAWENVELAATEVGIELIGHGFSTGRMTSGIDMRLNSILLIGYGPLPPAPPSTPQVMAAAAPTSTNQRRPALALTCSLGEARPAPLAALPQAPVKKPSGKGKSGAQPSEASKTTSELTVGPPGTWTFRWLGASERGSEVRTFRGKAPAGASAGAKLSHAFVAGDEAYFVITHAPGSFVAHVTPRVARFGRIPEEAARVVSYSAPAPGRPFVWLTGVPGGDDGGQVWSWSVPEEPRALARYANRGTLKVGTPSKTAVPLGFDEARSDGKRRWRLALPTGGPARGPAPWLPMTGWTRHDVGALDALGLCTGPGGGLFDDDRKSSGVDIPLGDESVLTDLTYYGTPIDDFWVRADGPTSCIQSYSGRGKVNGVAAQLDFDFADGSGQLVLTPEKGKATARRVTCTLGAAPAKP